MGQGGVLQFTLGLEVYDFLSKVGVSSAAISGLTGIGESLHRTFEKVFQAFERGAALEHLSRRTGESAGNLYRLQAAIQACGGSAEGLPQMLFLMQKALGGVSEMGESTADVFHKLHLNISELKRAGPAEALGQIVERLSGLSQDSAAKASSMIFGRMGSGMAVQMSRSPQEFREAFADAARQADIFERAGAAFARIERTIGAIKREFTGFWAGLAEGAAPAVQSILDWLRKIDLTSIGQRIGKVIGAISEAISSGEGTGLFVEAFQAAFEQIGNYGMRTFNGLFAAFITRLNQVASEMPQIFGVIGPGIVAVLNGFTKNWIAETESSLGEMAESLGAKNIAMRLFGAASGLAGSSAAESAAAAEHAKTGLMGILARSAGDVGQMGAAFQAGWGAIGSPFGNDATARLQAHLASLMGRLGGATGPMAGAGGEQDVSFGAGLTHRTEGNVFEKMGFVMGGGGGPMQGVERNTARSADLLADIRAALVDKPGIEVQDTSQHAVM